MESVRSKEVEIDEGTRHLHDITVRFPLNIRESD